MTGILEALNIAKQARGLVDDLHTSEEEKQKLRLEFEKLDQALQLGQQAINLKEAEHSSVFVAGWRPFIGWVGGTALAYVFVANPLLNWLGAFVGSLAGFEWVDAPALDISELMALILTMMGSAGLRTYERTKGVARGKIK